MRRDAAAVRVNSESEELKQGVADFFLLVLSPLDVDKSFSFLSEDGGQQSAEAASRWGPLWAIVCLETSSLSRA